ncbi:MAG: gamma-glutamylcyclotransferase [Halieaceae bacterium]
MSDNTHWVFGYGSLIYKVDFPFLQREAASIHGWARRFWQGSHDHRGTPDSPGRVVTLIPSAGTLCRGVAYKVKHEVFEHLDHREKNGYQQRKVQLSFERERPPETGVVYVADEDNHAYLGDCGSIAELAAHIARSHGPSGSNSDYLLQLATALRELGEEDTHVFELESALLAHDQNRRDRP